MNITQITIEEVRCFAAPQQFNIRPLTFLVGENSTGKTTTLACFQVLADFLSTGEVDFNLDPYSMGVFEEIVRRSKRTEKSFTIGFSFSDAGGNYELIADFVESEGGVEPFLSSAKLKFDDGESSLNTETLLDAKGSQFSIMVKAASFASAWILTRPSISGFSCFWLP